MKRLLLLAVAALLSASALLAVGILLFGHFGETEGRILGTTALLAGYGLLALPAAILLDQGRLRTLAIAVVAQAAAAVSLSLWAVWSGGGGEALGKTIGTVTFFLVAAAQTAALAARRRGRDPRWVRVLFPCSVGLAGVAAAAATGAVWTNAGADYGRVVGAVVVLDLLAVALQPILARAQAATSPIRLRILVDSGERVELTVEASDLAGAAAKAIRGLERDGRRVVALEAPDRAEAPRSLVPGQLRARTRSPGRP